MALRSDVRARKLLFGLLLALPALGCREKPKRVVRTEPWPAPAVSARLRALLAKLAQGEVDRGALTPEFAAHVTDERLAEAKDRLGSNGPLNELVLVQRAERDGAIQLEYRAIFGKVPTRVMIRLMPDGKIGGIGFRPE